MEAGRFSNGPFTRQEGNETPHVLLVEPISRHRLNDHDALANSAHARLKHIRPT
jgi:hypothetical protein